MAKGREAKQASLNVPVPIPPNYGRFYALRSREDKGALPNKGTATSRLVVKTTDSGKARGVAFTTWGLAKSREPIDQGTSGTTTRRGALDGSWYLGRVFLVTGLLGVANTSANSRGNEEGDEEQEVPFQVPP
uniref:Uncharacterized protein n=1 Tax=Solanum tuberosum TaxID=4113 RepID=M1DFD1_SOLTU